MIGQYLTIHGDVISHVNVSSVSVEDGGEYSCTAENRAGQETHRARLNVYGNVTLHSLLITNLPSCAALQSLLIINLPSFYNPVQPSKVHWSLTYPPVDTTCLTYLPSQSIWTHNQIIHFS